MRPIAFCAAIGVGLGLCAVGHAHAEAIKIGSLKTLSSGAAIFIAQEQGYFDAEARLDTKDVSRQIAWYKSQGLGKGEADGDTFIDKRYVTALPAP